MGLILPMTMIMAVVADMLVIPAMVYLGGSVPIDEQKRSRLGSLTVGRNRLKSRQVVALAFTDLWVEGVRTQRWSRIYTKAQLRALADDGRFLLE